jgi:hypothetical protein
MRIIKPNWKRAKLKRGLVVSPSEKKDASASAINNSINKNKV